MIEQLTYLLFMKRLAPSLAHFVRRMVGLDRSAARALFSEFLNDRSLSPQQIRFVEMVIEGIFERLDGASETLAPDAG